MTILLLGRNGQVGWELRRALAPLGTVVAPGRDEADLSRPETLRACVRAHTPTLIVNAAAYTGVDNAEREPELALAVNGTAPGVLAEEAARLGVPLVHYSTDYVFDGTLDRPYLETDPTEPLGVYGRSKLAGDRAVRATGGPHLILRTSWVYGARGHNFLRTMLRLMHERDELRVVDDQWGAPAWCRLIADVTAQVLARLHGPTPRMDWAAVTGVYHLAPAGATSWHGFAQAIAEGDPHKATQSLRTLEAIPTAQYPTPARRPANSRFDCSKLRETFGIVLPDWRASLALALEEVGDAAARGGA